MQKEPKQLELELHERVPTADELEQKRRAALKQRLRKIALTLGDIKPESDTRIDPSLPQPLRKSSYLTVTAVYRDPETNLQYVDCECKCGNKLLKQHYTRIMRGVIDSCGCKKTEKTARTERRLQEVHKRAVLRDSRRQDLRGKRIGYLQVIDYMLYEPHPSDVFFAEYKNLEDSEFYWKLECACGRTLWMTTNEVRRTTRRHCGGDVCKTLYAQKYPRGKVRKYILRNFAGINYKPRQT